VLTDFNRFSLLCTYCSFVIVVPFSGEGAAVVSSIRGPRGWWRRVCGHRLATNSESEAHQHTSLHVPVDRHRQSCDERAVLTWTRRMKWLQVSLHHITCVGSPDKSYHLMLFSVNQVLRIVKIDSFREFSGVWSLGLLNCSKLCLINFFEYTR
jgi:hypothetical protein